jgi:hypothetical protein
MLDHVECFLDLLSESCVFEILAQEEGFDDPSQFTEPLITRMLHVNRYRIASASAVPMRRAVAYLIICQMI